MLVREEHGLWFLKKSVWLLTQNWFCLADWEVQNQPSQ